MHWPKSEGRRIVIQFTTKADELAASPVQQRSGEVYAAMQFSLSGGGHFLAG